jgi:hypothetical protein
MSLEQLKAIFEVGGVILLFLTFVFGAGLVITANRINAVQSRELHEFQLKIEAEQQKTAQAQKDAAKAQLALNQSLVAFAKRSGDRVLNFSTFVGSLKGQPAKTVEIVYVPNDQEAERFANDLLRALQEVGWSASARKLHPDDHVGGLSLPSISGIFALSRNIEDATHFSTLIFNSMLFGGGGASTTAPDLPEHKIVVVVGDRIRL